MVPLAVRFQVFPNALLVKTAANPFLIRRKTRPTIRYCRRPNHDSPRITQNTDPMIITLENGTSGDINGEVHSFHSFHCCNGVACKAAFTVTTNSTSCHHYTFTPHQFTEIININYNRRKTRRSPRVNSIILHITYLWIGICCIRTTFTPQTP